MKIRYLTKRRKKELKNYAREHAEKKFRKALIAFNKNKGMAALPNWERQAEGTESVILYLNKKYGKLFEEFMISATEEEFICTTQKCCSSMCDADGEPTEVCLITYEIIYPKEKGALKKVLRWIAETLKEED